MTSAKDRYIDLVVRALRGQLHGEDDAATSPPDAEELEHCQALLEQAKEKFQNIATAGTLLEAGPAQLASMLRLMNKKRRVYTMTSEAGVRNVRECTEIVLRDDVPGDLCETGVWKGGLCILMRAILAACDDDIRSVWVADSFEGLPEPAGDADAVAHFLTGGLSHLAVPLDDVKSAFAAFDLLDDRVRFLEGWFCDTLPNAPIEKLALLRLDGDWYESTRDALESLYPRLSPGGFCIIDDYGLPLGCRRAVDEYRATHDIREPLVVASDQTVFWRKR